MPSLISSFRRRSVRCFLQSSWLLFCTSASGCSEPPESLDVAQHSQAMESTCTPISLGPTDIIPCASDDGCPCGSHCTAMLCVQECFGDDSCAGDQVCNHLGRCEAPMDPDPGPEPGPQGQLQVHPIHQFVTESRDTYNITLAADRTDIPSVQIVANDDAEVRCAPTGDFARECTLTLRADDYPVQIGVRLRPYAPPAPGDGPRLWSVRVFAHDQPTVVDFELSAPAATSEDTPEEGIYAGHATLVSAGLASASGTGPLSPSLRVPLQARVFEVPANSGQYRVSLEDPYRSLSSTGRLTASLTPAGNDFTWELDRVHFVGVENPSLDETSVRLAALGDAHLGSESLEVEMDATTDDVLAGADSLNLRWRLALRRQGDLAVGESFSSLPPVSQRSDAEQNERTETTLPWAQAALDLMGPPRHLFEDEDGARVHTLLRGWRNDPEGLLQCEWDTDTRMPSGATHIGSVNLVANAMCGIRYESDLERAYSRELSLGFRTAGCIWGGFRQCGARTDCVRHAFDPFGSSATRPARSSFSRRTSRASAGRAHADTRWVGGTNWGSVQKLHNDYGCTLTEVSGTKSCAIEDYETHPGAAACAQRYLCYAPPGSGYSLQSSELGSDVLDASGDLNCGDGSDPTTFGLFVNRDLPLSDAMSAAEMLNACMSDLGANLPHDVDVDASSLAAVYGTEGCMNLGRFHRAYEWASTPARGRMGGIFSSESAADALAHRLVQQWLQVHMFLAREGGNQGPLADLLADLEVSPGVDGPPPPSLESLLLRVESGLDLLLHPRMARSLAALEPAVLAAPDYRELLGVSTSPEGHHEQNVGVSVTTLETLSAHLSLVDSVLTREAGRLQGLTSEARAALGGALRRVGVARALANVLYARAGSPSWEERWRLANHELDAILERVLLHASELEARINPLGIDEADLPLYFDDVHQSPGTKFRALSSYLLENKARTSVTRARASVEAAESSFIAMRSARVQEARDAAETDARVDALKREYGRPIIELCGAREGLGSHNVLEAWAHVDPATCFLDESRGACVFEPADMLSSLQSDDIRDEICRVAVLRNETGLGLRFGYSALDSAINDIASDLAGGMSPDSALTGVTVAPGGTSFSVNGTSHDIERLSAPPEDFDLLDQEDVLAARSDCEGHFPARGLDAALVGGGPMDVLDQPDCYLGALGQDALALRAAVKDIQLARSRMAELVDRYDIAKQSCLLLEEGAVDQIAETEFHNMIMEGLIEAKRRADRIASAGGLFSKIGQMTNPIAAIAGGIGAGLSFGAEFEAAGIQARMSQAELDHSLQMERIRLGTQISVCYNDSEMHLVGLRSAALQLERATLDFSRTKVQLTNRQRLLASLFGEASAVLARESERTVPTVGHDYWLNANLTEASRRMQLARRASFLAARAVGWEFQAEAATRTLRSDVLTAQSPDTLDATLDDLASWVDAHGIGGTPEELWSVLSLRDDVLKIASREDIPGATEGMDAADRFQLFVRQPRFAYFDQDGNYAGQRLRFSLSPRRPQPSSTEPGIGVAGFSEDCAERLWSVNALLVGPGVAGSSSIARVTLRQHNSFYSKWCFAAPDALEFQAASVRPQRNLFRDPIFGAESAPSSAREDYRFASARIISHVNTPQTEFEAEAFTNGESLELAARGLYSEYALEFSKDAMVEGLDLDSLDDVLLRLDYVSVAKPSSVPFHMEQPRHNAPDTAASPNGTKPSDPDTAPPEPPRERRARMLPFLVHGPDDKKP